MIGISGILALEEKDRAGAIDDAIRRAYATPDGQVALAALLDHCGFLDEATNDEQRALNNFAKYMVKKLGMSSTYRIVAALEGGGNEVQRSATRSRGRSLSARLRGWFRASAHGDQGLS